MPADAPEPGACVRIERPEPGLAVVVFDPPHRSLAVLDAPLIRDLDAAVAELEQERELRGVVFTGRAPLQFLAGADLEGIAGMDDPIAVNDVVRAVHRLFLRIEKLRPRTVSAFGGPCPGGAYELSLACDVILAADDDRTRVGLPETQLGILPGWGGTHRLPERIGVPLALDAILTGRLFPAKVAWKRGMVDRLTQPARLREVAEGIAMRRVRVTRRKRGWKRWAVDRNPLARKLIRRQAHKSVMAKTHGHYPAPLRALDLTVRAVGVSRAEAESREATAIAELVLGPVCKSLVSLFFASEAAKKAGKAGGGFEPRRLERGGVVGGGVMGGGIASLMALKGLDVRLSDLDRGSLDRAVLTHRADVDKRRRRRRVRPHQADRAVDRLTTTTRLDGFDRAEIVVEAVAERLDVKQQVLGTLAEQVGDDCILATNTSSLSVDAIADGLPHPERVVGMHFFNPVAKMPLVEVVRGARTDEQVARQVAALAIALGKTPVVVADVAGFLVNRVLGPYLDEAVRTFVEGRDPAALDRQMLEFGMPMGPLRLLDEVGLDIAQHASTSLHEAYGVRMRPCEGLAELAGPKRLGAKTGRGFYVHAKGKGKPQLADDLARFQTGNACRNLGAAQVHDRLILGMVNEAARCLEEGVVASEQELDLATVMGTGFAPFRGGLMRHARSLGLAEVVRRLEAVAAAPDVAGREGGAEKFAPADWLREQANRD